MKKNLTFVFTILLTILTAQAATHTVTQITDDGAGTTAGSLSYTINIATGNPVTIQVAELGISPYCVFNIDNTTTLSTHNISSKPKKNTINCFI